MISRLNFRGVFNEHEMPAAPPDERNQVDVWRFLFPAMSVRRLPERSRRFLESRLLRRSPFGGCDTFPHPERAEKGIGIIIAKQRANRSACELIVKLGKPAQLPASGCVSSTVARPTPSIHARPLSEGVAELQALSDLSK